MKNKNKTITLSEYIKERGDLDKSIEDWSMELILRGQLWVTEVENYCSLAGVLPIDLINSHKKQNKAAMKLKNTKNKINT